MKERLKNVKKKIQTNRKDKKEGTWRVWWKEGRKEEARKG